MNSKTLFKELVSSITTDEGQTEIHSMVYIVLEKFLHLRRSDILSEKYIELTPELDKQLSSAIERLNAHEPVQYIVGECEFLGRKFIVDKNVLIPRPETEELVDLILRQVKSKKKILRIIDIGTGSGCIPITLALEISTAEIMATDVSQGALRIAHKNASRLSANVTFIHHDILQQKLPSSGWDIIISNPPYVTVAEKPAIRRNVLDYEPHLALFVPETDPLLFFNIILERAKDNLNPGGMVFFEIHEDLGYEISELMKDANLSNVEVIRDISGKDRFAKGEYRK